MSLLGERTKIFERPIPVTEIAEPDKGRFFVLADAAISSDGFIVNGDALAISDTYHGALRALRRLNVVGRRVAVRRLIPRFG